MALKTEKKIAVPSSEYRRLKALDKRFGGLLNYLADIGESRKQIKRGEVISQEYLFRFLAI